MDGVITIRAAAKINLYLAVGPVRPDGFHPLATVFQSVGLYDDIFAAPAPTISLTVAGNGRHLPTGESNLAVRAAHLLAEHAGLSRYGARLHIHKRIPIAGGMAGGSADAAGTLVALNKLWDLRASEDELCDLGAKLGSDVPFCVRGGTQLGAGRGEQLNAVTCPVPGAFVIVTMKRGLSTPRVFAEFDAQATGEELRAVDEEFLRALQAGNWPRIAELGRNDLQAPALLLHLGARRTIDWFHARKVPAMISGSGPTVIAYLREGDDGAELARAVAKIPDVAQTFVVNGPVAGVEVLEGTKTP